MALVLLALVPCHPCLQPVSRLEQALAGQGFQLAVADGGAAVLTASATGERKSPESAALTEAHGPIPEHRPLAPRVAYTRVDHTHIL